MWQIAIELKIILYEIFFDNCNIATHSNILV